MTRALVTADLHLEKGLTYSDDRLGEQEEVWTDIMRLAVERECDCILFAGDAFEYRSPSSAARAAFQRPLAYYDIPVLAIPGNHDVKHPRFPTALDLMAPELGGNLLTVSRVPELVEIGGMVVATLPWVPFRGDFGATAEALLNLAEELRERSRVEHPDLRCVLLGHWALDLAWTPTGKSAAEFNEPVLPVDDILRLGYDAAIVGHVHKPDAWENVISPGSPMPLDFGEASCEHGVWVLELGLGAVRYFEPIESRRFVTLDWDLRNASIGNGRLQLPPYGDVADAIVRLRYMATEGLARRISDATLRESLLAAGAHKVWQILPQIERVARARVENAGTMSPLEAVDAWIASTGRTLPSGVRDRAHAILEDVAA